MDRRIENQKILLSNLDILRKGESLEIRKKHSLFDKLRLSKFESAIFEMMLNEEPLSTIILALSKYPGYSKFYQLHKLLVKLVFSGIILNKDFYSFFSKHSKNLPDLEAWSSTSYLKYRMKKETGKYFDKTYQSHFEEIIKDDSKTFTERFRKLPFIRKFPTPILDKIIQFARKEAVLPKQVMFREGGDSKDLFVVIEGSFAVYQKASGELPEQQIATLKEGAIFGEVGFFLDSPQESTIISLTRSKVVRIPYTPTLVQKSLDNNLKIGFQQRIKYLQVLISSLFFTELPSESLDVFSELGTFKEYDLNEVIMKEGENSNSMCVILKGKVGIFQKQTHITNCTVGSVIGEIGVLVQGTQRTSSTVALSKVLICEISSHELWSCFSQNLFLAIKFEKIARNRLILDKKRTTALE